jgi:uncharacterized membrane protein (UPF0127 family)
MRKRSRVLGCLAALTILIALPACSKSKPLTFPVGRPVVFETSAGSPTLSPVEVANTPERRAQGLMWRSSLAPNAGMVFPFGQATNTTFWMKNTTIPLSIAFVGSDGTIVGIDDMPPCTTETCPTYAPNADYTEAIEANQGWFESHGVKVGDHLAEPPA